MGRDPAFMLYSQDFLVGVSDLTMEERGQYITLLCTQHQKGRLSPKLISLTVGNASEDVLAKFDIDENGLYYNERLEAEIEKRCNYSKSRAENGSKGGRPRKDGTEKAPENHMDNHMQNHMVSVCKPYAKAYENHTENENRNENSNEIDNEILDVISSSHCPYKAILDLFNNICTSFPKLRLIDGKRKEAVQARWKTYGSLDVFKELFERAEASRFLKGENDSNWKADFDWMMRPTNMAKILEGKYDRMQTRPSGNVFLDILREGGEI